MRGDDVQGDEAARDGPAEISLGPVHQKEDNEVKDCTDAEVHKP